MKKLLSVVTVLLLFTGLAGCRFLNPQPDHDDDRGHDPGMQHKAPTRDDDPPRRSHGGGNVERRAFDLVNDYRASRGLPRLVWDDVISRECRDHSRYCASVSSISHTGFQRRVANIRNAYQIAGAGENVAMNWNMPNPADAAVKGWIRSPGHHRNMVGNWTHAGMGLARDSRGAYYLTQIFVRKR